jgi:hypothetical protein
MRAEDKCERFLRALTKYVQAEVAAATREQECDSMGAYYEERELEVALTELLTREEPVVVK